MAEFDTTTDEESSVSYNSENEQKINDEIDDFLDKIDPDKRFQTIQVPDVVLDYIRTVCDDEYYGGTKKRTKIEKIRFITITLACLGVSRDHLSNSSITQLLEQLEEIRRDKIPLKVSREAMVFIVDLFYLEELAEFVNNPKMDSWIRDNKFYEEIDYAIKKNTNIERIEQESKELECKQLRKLISELDPYESDESDGDEKSDCMRFCSETKRLYHKLGVMIMKKFINHDVSNIVEDCVTKICESLAVNKNFKIPFKSCNCISIPPNFTKIFGGFYELVKDEEPRITILSLLTLIMCRTWFPENPIKKGGNIISDDEEEIEKCSTVQERISDAKNGLTREIMDRIKLYIDFGGDVRKMKPHPFLICLTFDMPELCVALIETEIMSQVMYFDEVTHCISRFRLRSRGEMEYVTPMNIVLQPSEDDSDILTNSKLYLVAKMIDHGCNPMKRSSTATTALHTLLKLPVRLSNKEGMAMFSDILHVMVEALSLDRDYMELLFQPNEGGPCIMELMVMYKVMFLPHFFESIRTHFKNKTTKGVIFDKIFEGYYVAPCILHIYNILNTDNIYYALTLGNSGPTCGDWPLISIVYGYVKNVLVQKRTCGVNISLDYCTDIRNVIKELLLYIHTLFNKSSYCNDSWDLLGYFESPFDAFCESGSIKGVMAVLSAQNLIKLTATERTGKNASPPLLVFMALVLVKIKEKGENIDKTLVKLNIIIEKLLLRLGYNEIRDEHIPNGYEMSKDIIMKLERINGRHGKEETHKSFQIERFIKNIKQITFIKTDDEGNIEDVKVYS